MSDGSPRYSLRVSEDFAVKHPKQVESISKHHLVYSLAGLGLGLACVIGGIVLFLNGIMGSTNWTLRVFGAESTVTDAAPGVILFVTGVVIIFVTRFAVRIHR
jgi:hypothetical protein